MKKYFWDIDYVSGIFLGTEKILTFEELSF